MNSRAAEALHSRRQQLLNESLLAGLVCALAVTAIDLARWFLASQRGGAKNLVSDLVIGLVIIGAWRLNRLGYTRAAGLILFGFVTLALVIRAQTLDSSLMVYAVPVGVASFVIAPAAAFGVAAVCVASYSLFFLAGFGQGTDYNVVAMATLFLIAFVTWLISTRLERALQEARAATQEHEHRLKAEQEQRLFAETMQEVGAALAASLDLGNVFQCLMEQVSRILPNDMVNIMQISDGRVRVTHGQGYERFNPPGFLESVDWPIAATPTLRRMMETGDAVIIGDTAADPDWIRYPETEWTRSYAGVPIRMGTDIIGFLNLNSIQPGFFGPEHAARLRAFAAMAAVALQNAQLYEAARQSAAEVCRLNETLEQRVTERTAQLSAANVELKRLNRMRDEFLANMSHELRTPLTGILGLSEALQMDVYGALAERQFQAVHALHESGQHLLRLINDILDLSKIDAGKIKLQISPVSVTDVCQASLRLVREAAQKKKLQTAMAVDLAVTTVEADERRLKQMLVNLLSNAVKFTGEGGRFGLEVTGDTERGLAHFTVWDTGIGISPEDAARLFQPFVQVDSSLSRPYEGAGLGLMLVRRMAELHGGSVALESAGIPGKGSRFTVSLPWSPAVNDLAVARVESGPAPNPDLPPPAGVAYQAVPERALVLLADDNETNLAIMADFLRSQSCRIEMARNGAEALARARASRPDLVVMDIHMPVMDGLEAARRMRADPGLKDVPIIAVTALAMPGDRERCLEAGANDYVSKPIRLGEFAVKLAHWLARQP